MAASSISIGGNSSDSCNIYARKLIYFLFILSAPCLYSFLGKIKSYAAAYDRAEI